MSARHWVISIFIILVLAMQASTFVTGTKVWPFMAYAMYADAKSGVTHSRVEAELADGRTLAVDEELMGFNYFAWRNHYLYPFARGDFSRVPEVVEEVEARAGRAPQSVVMVIVEHKIKDGEMTERTKTVTLYPREQTP